MPRALIGFVIAPLLWSLLVVPASELVYGLLVYEHRYWPWSILWSVDWSLLGFGYLLMLVAFVPYIIICRAFRKNSVWVYALGGLVLGFVCPFYLLLLKDLLFSSATAAFRNGPWLVIPEAWHFQSGGALASCVSLVAFWAIAVRNNNWFNKKQPNSALNRTRKNGAPVS
jgi:hypothetical protein